MPARSGPKNVIEVIKEEIISRAAINVARVLSLINPSFLSRNLKYGNTIVTDDKEPNISMNVRMTFDVIPLLKIGRIKLKSRYLLASVSKITSPTSVRVTVTITTIKIVLRFLVNTIAAGTMKNNKQYQLGLDKKKFVCTELASTEELSIDVKNRPNKKVNKKILLSHFGKAILNILDIL